jgi:uncharacterized protein with ParB-like and HNH nuclease domain
MPWDHLISQWICKDDTGVYRHGKEDEAVVDLQPDFQRGYVWTQEQQIAYIEAMLAGSITGRAIYFNHPTWGSFHDFEKYPLVCVDGQQRIGAVFAFMENKIPIFAHYFSEYEDRLPMNRAYFDLYCNNLKTNKEVYEWYLHLNAGGTVHTKEELDKV